MYQLHQIFVEKFFQKVLIFDNLQSFRVLKTSKKYLEIISFGVRFR